MKKYIIKSHALSTVCALFDAIMDKESKNHLFFVLT